MNARQNFGCFSILCFFCRKLSTQISAATQVQVKKKKKKQEKSERVFDAAFGGIRGTQKREACELLEWLYMFGVVSIVVRV